jgi:hypothetical protein
MKKAAKRALSSAFTAFPLASVVFISGLVAVAQTISPKPTPTPIDPPSADKSSPAEDRSPLTTFEEEIRAKRAIKLAEKEHQENLNRAREICNLGKEIQEDLKKKPSLGREDSKKIDRLEKLTKKIRGEAGGEDNEVKILDRPTDALSASSQIADAAESLSKSVQNTPRQVVSASVIDHANVLLELIRILRGFIIR